MKVYAPEGIDCTVRLDFVIESPAGKAYLLPDGIEIDYILSDPTGAVVSAGKIPVTANATGIDFTIPGADLVKTGEFSFRRLLYYWTTNSIPYRKVQIVHVITPVPALIVSEDSIRNTLGIVSFELPDFDIDIYVGYLNFKRSYPDIAVDTILTSGTIQSLYLNNAMEVFIALNLLPALRLKVHQQIVTGVEQFKRFDIDWDKLKEELSSLLNANITQLLGTTADTRTYITRSDQPDPFNPRATDVPPA